MQHCGARTGTGATRSRRSPSGETCAKILRCELHSGVLHRAKCTPIVATRHGDAWTSWLAHRVLLAGMVLRLIIALPLVGAVVYGAWLASRLGIAATWPRRAGLISRLGPDRGSEAVTGDGGP
jgi:hypothetical protein